MVRVGVVGAGGGPTHWIPVKDKPYEWLLRVNWLPDSRHLSFKTLDRSQQELGLYVSDPQGAESNDCSPRPTPRGST